MTDTTTEVATTPIATTVTTTATVKPGWKTTELYFKLAAAALSVLFASGVFTSDRTLAIAGIVASVLTAMGYTVSRTLVKTAGVLLVVVLATSQLGACTWLKSEGAVAKKAAIDCTTSTAHDAIKQFGPIVDALLVQATTPDGKVNWQPVKDLGKGLGAELGGCVLATVVAHELAPAPPDPNAPKAAELVLDAASLRAGFNEIRNAQFGGATFKTDAGPI